MDTEIDIWKKIYIIYGNFRLKGSRFSIKR